MARSLMHPSHRRPGVLVTPVCGLLLLGGVFACAPETSTSPAPVSKQAAPVKPAEPVSDEALAERYLAAKGQIEALGEEADAATIVAKLDAVIPELRAVAESAKDPHLRANASLLLGNLYELRGDRRSAISFYEQARDLVPDEVDTYRALALALASDNQHARAAELQREVVARDPDDLGARLLLGELLVKAGEDADATVAYAEYEARRKGLMDGLTLQNKDGSYVRPPAERAECAFALAPARDNGTAFALLYALEHEQDAKVRAAIVETMGMQRLAAYKPALDKVVAAEDAKPEKDAALLEVLRWSLDEIARDPVDATPGPAPELGAETAGAEDSPGAPPSGGADATSAGEPAEPGAEDSEEAAPAKAPAAERD
ncbi:MAG: hypothetical protein R3A51_00040 [Nannocystaceae bacterium]